jgi:hypothetical protein
MKRTSVGVPRTAAILYSGLVKRPSSGYIFSPEFLTTLSASGYAIAIQHETIQRGFMFPNRKNMVILSPT